MSNLDTLDRDTCPSPSASMRKDYRTLVMEFKTQRPDQYAFIIDYLEEKFELKESDLHGHYRDFHRLIGLAESSSRFDTTLILESSLARISVRNVLLLDGGEPIDEEDLDAVLQTLRDNFGGRLDSMKIEIEKLFPHEPAIEFDSHMIDRAREFALDEMKAKYPELADQWKEALYGLDDRTLAEYFTTQTAALKDHLSTYFGSACKGLINEGLVRRIDDVSRVPMEKDWPKFKRSMQARVARALDPGRSPLRAPQFRPENITFHENCSQAFVEFVRSFMFEGDRVLVSGEEYRPFLKLMRKAGITVDPLPRMEDKETFLGQLTSSLTTEEYDYILMSEFSRHGGAHPLRSIDSLRQALSRKTRLIVDAAQSAGRKQHDMYACQADAVILSTGKGSDTGPGQGILALSDRLQTNRDLENQGTRHFMPHAAYAMNPAGLAVPGQPFGILTPYQRQRANEQLKAKFLQLLEAINGKNERKVEVRGAQLGQNAGHGLELSIPGTSRETFAKKAEELGVYIESDYGEKDPNVMRIAFHPYMNNESLLLLGSLIDEQLA